MPAPSTGRAALRLAAYTGLALTLLAVSVAAATGLIAVGRGADPLAVDSLSLGLVCALVGWLFVAVFHLRRETRPVAAPDRAQFLGHARAVLEEMGYEVAPHGPDTLTARPTFTALLFGGGVRVVLGAGPAAVTGPRVTIERLQNRLRQRHHFQTVQEALHKRRHGAERVFKRIEVSLRLTPDQLAAVKAELLDRLARENDVRCELNVMVESPAGLRAGLIDEQVCGWLEQHGIPFELHRDFIQMDEPIGTRRSAWEVSA